ncbi:hypothetical protein SLEP1_g29403 [Rubroshorea leprosula]|uniref:Amine oxidase domain-containing protein n=1 Tax=Rubroshorea leprosula TaxID=152421 RepID=A0AAV5K6X6_9ROSI|nr:hypothetical protein SLEP1_g29403 [Rubroshorea leprosula]
MRVAVIGAGISGLASAHVLAKAGVNVVLYEKEDYLGGHAKTVTFDGVDLDLGFMVFDSVTYLNMVEMFESHGVDMEASDMSFSVSLNKGQGCEWGSRSGMSSLFAQKTNVFNPYFWNILREILKFKDDVLSYLEVLENNPDIDRNETLGQFVKARSYSELFQRAYLVPICGSIWSCPSEGVMGFSAYSVLSLFRNHQLLQLFGCPQWLTVKGGSRHYVNKVKEELWTTGCQIRTGCEVLAVSTADEGCTLLCGDGSQEMFTGCIMAIHAPDALRLLGNEATYNESRILGAFQYVYSLFEEGGTIFTFEGNNTKCSLKTVMKVHNPQFYWKVMTQADLGLADAYINGDFSFVDNNEGLLNLIMILIASRDWNSSISKLSKKRGWWTPMFFAAGLTSANFFFKHLLRQNTLTQARRNISRHYDLNNELFALFLGETMAYSCAVFEKENEELKVAQQRKFSLLIEKARINNEHEILDIGCGWGSFAIEVVKQTGCRYTGISLSQEQLKYAEMKVQEAGLQDHIQFQLCDYRQLPNTHKYDRIISCEMIEHVGHKYMEDFFGCCDSVLAEDGLLVLQFISIPDERYEGYRLSSDFIKEYIFPGGCLPSLSRITSAMAAASRLCVEHVENIGIQYYQTLRNWRQNFLGKKSEINALGFDDKFIRTWEYYFDYCAAGFKTRTLGDYQVVFSRPGNAAALGNPYQGSPSAY